MICLCVSSNIKVLLRWSALPKPLVRSVVCLGLVEIPLLVVEVVLRFVELEAAAAAAVTPSGTVKGSKLL